MYIRVPAQYIYVYTVFICVYIYTADNSRYRAYVILYATVTVVITCILMHRLLVRTTTSIVAAQ